MSNKIIILGIESSCDDTSAAIISDGYILSNIIANQKVHEKYGGVVPELASRAHQKNIIPVVDTAIKEAGIKKEDISAISFTKGPGLLGSLLVGSSFAKSFALGLDIPLIAVNHMKGHIMAHFIKNKGEENKQPNFPFLCLTVSGGHTQIVLVKSVTEMIVIGETLDDAAGEAFDKGAKLLGLGYPGGPAIAELAKSGDSKAYPFPRPMMKEKHNLNFSFSGLKTALMYKVKDLTNKELLTDKTKADLAVAYEKAIVDSLVQKTELAVDITGIQSVVIAGGVGANKKLRNSMRQKLAEKDVKVSYPSIEFCTDNAAMIALTGLFNYQKGMQNIDYKIEVNPRWPIDKIESMIS